MCEVPLKTTKWDRASSFFQVKTVLRSVVVAIIQRAYHDSQLGLSDLKSDYSHIKRIPSPALGHDGLKPKVQPFCSEALISLPPVWILLHLFRHDAELVSEATESCPSRQGTAMPT